MADTPGKHAMVQSTAYSSLAIVQDKRSAHRPGGCVGILFQLFDWNRRFAKKKLFPKKFLPPVRAPKRVSKKFDGDDKMPISKFLLIAGDNSGGFPTTKKPPETVQDSAMLAPSLVARLMGLESIPSGPQKPRMAVDLENYKVSSSTRHDLDLDLGDQGKLELRPQKLQKTGNIDKPPAAVHSESSSSLLSNKSVLSRKQHREKPSSPVKNPRILCKKNSTTTTNRLMEAAVKILEPGLQQRNRSRCALTYVDSPQSNYSEEGIDVSASSPSIASESKPPTSISHGRRLPSAASAAQAKPNVQIRTREHIERRLLQRNSQEQRKPTREEGVGLRGVPRQNSHVTSVKERVSIRSLNGSNGSPSIRNVNARVRPGTAPPSLAGVQLETKSNVTERKTSSAHGGKRPNNNNKPNLATNRSLKNEKINPARGMKVQNTCSTSKSGVLKSNLRKKPVVEADPILVSSVEDVKTQICQTDNIHLSPSDSRASRSVGTCFTGDELSALLEQKIRELNSLESVVEDGSSRSTATILEELISALTKGRPMMHHHQEERYDCPDESNDSPDPSSVINSQWFKPENMKDQEKTDGGAVGLSNSPVSILEASFSTTDSCLSENLNCTPDYKPDADFSDSATSNNRAIATNLETLSVMYNFNRFPGNTEDLERNPSFVRQVISNIDLLLLSWSGGGGGGGLPCYESEDDVGSVIVDALDCLVDSSWSGTRFPVGRDTIQFRRFLFDCMVEYLDRRYGCYCKCSGYKVWEKRRGLFLNSEKLSSDVYLDIQKYMGVKNVDDIIDDEMRNLTGGEWKGFGVEEETFDAGMEIEQELLEALVEETIVDLFTL